MPDISELKPNKKESVIDCLKQAGIRIPRDRNRFFLSQCAFKQDEEILVLNFWYKKQIKNLGENIVIELDLPKLNEKAPYRPRSVRDVIKLAKDKSLKIHIIVLDGDMLEKNSKVSKRCLDPLLWSVKSYNEKTGKCVLIRDVRVDNGSRIEKESGIPVLSNKGTSPEDIKAINSLVGQIRLPILYDRLQRNAFELLRAWRQTHPLGLLLCVNGKKALWHNASCKHIGDPNANHKQWEISLTKRRKVLGGTIEDLKRWASENGLNARSCSDCMKEPYTVANLADGFKLLDEAKSVATEEEFPDGPSPRVTTTIQRIVRDTELAKAVKQYHRYHCQICGEQIALPDGRFYAEAHHIRPLGSPHDGPDKIENILCLCPNHHVALDYGCLRIDKEMLRKCEDHQISDEHISYHNNHLFTGKI